MMGGLFDDADVIYSYSRAQAIEDGVLVDCSEGWLGEMALEAGIRYPIAMTATAFARYVELTDVARACGNDEKGRWWDVCNMFRFAVRAKKDQSPEILFEFRCIVDLPHPTKHTLKAVVGPGDDPAPCLTFMLPNED